MILIFCLLSRLYLQPILASFQGHSDIVKAFLETGANVGHQKKWRDSLDISQQLESFGYCQGTVGKRG